MLCSARAYMLSLSAEYWIDSFSRSKVLLNRQHEIYLIEMYCETWFYPLRSHWIGLDFILSRMHDWEKSYSLIKTDFINKYAVRPRTFVRKVKRVNLDLSFKKFKDAFGFCTWMIKCFS